MSTIDGLMLASGYTFVTDIIYRKFNLSELDNDKDKASRILVFVRFALLVAVIVGTVGVFYLNSSLNIKLFDLTYLMIIFQLALFGPVIMAMFDRSAVRRAEMTMAILLSLVVGFGTYAWGIKSESNFLMTGAGFFGLIVSILSAFVLTKK